MNTINDNKTQSMIINDIRDVVICLVVGFHIAGVWFAPYYAGIPGMHCGVMLFGNTVEWMCVCVGSLGLCE